MGICFFIIAVKIQPSMYNVHGTWYMEHCTWSSLYLRLNNGESTLYYTFKIKIFVTAFSYLGLFA